MNKQIKTKGVIKRGLRSLRVYGLSLTIKKLLCRCGQKLVNKYKDSLNAVYEEKSASSTIDISSATSDIATVGFCIRGGMGDRLIALNYLYNLKKKYEAENLVFDIYFDGGESFEKILLDSDAKFWRKHGAYSAKVVEPYDWFVYVDRYPFQLKDPSERLKKISPKFYEYTELCKKFKGKHQRYADCLPFSDGIRIIVESMHGNVRLQQADFYGFLGIGRNYDYHINCQGSDTLQKFGITKPFITIHRGSGVAFAQNVIKLLPQEKYNQLISLIKAEWGDKITIVQIGVSADYCPAMNGVDINVVGKTDMSQARDLVGSSLLHIDGEGGYVHLRSSINSSKPSVVFFGPTSKKYYGYDGNINISGDSCNGGAGCEWLSEDYYEKCIVGDNIPHCMQNIDIAKVYPQISEAIKQQMKKIRIEVIN